MTWGRYDWKVLGERELKEEVGERTGWELVGEMSRAKEKYNTQVK